MAFDDGAGHLRPVFAWLAILASCAMPSLGQAAGGCQVQSVELPVRMAGTLAIATVGINGKQVSLAVDSGASFSMLTDAAAAQLGLPLARNSAVRVGSLTGTVDTHVTTVDKLQLARGDIPHVEFIVGGNDLGGGTLGVLGRNLLAVNDTEYDLAHGVIRILFPNDACDGAGMAYWAGTSPVTEIELLTDIHERLPSIRARVRLNGKDFVALFDSGASTTVVSLPAARSVGIGEADMTFAGRMAGAGQGSSRAWTAAFERFELGGEAVLHNRLTVSDLHMGSADMLLGIDFFLSHRIYVSKKQSKMYITYNGGPVFARNRSDSAGTTAFDAEAAASGVQTATADELARRGAASASRGDLAAALADLDRACDLEPTSATFFAQRGMVREAMKQLAKAQDDYDKALALDPAQVDARFHRVALRLARKDADGARADLDVLDKALPAQADLRLAMSSAYLRIDQPAPALAQLNLWLPAHAHEIRRGGAFNSRCRLRTQMGIELDQALDDCDEAVDADGRNPASLESRGWLYLRLGKEAKALADFDRSDGLRPRNPWTLYGRGLAKTRLGDAARGDADLAEARAVLPDIEARVTRTGLATPPPPGR